MSNRRIDTQPTASKVHLLLECPWPFDKTKVPERGPVSPAAEYGVAFHSLMEQRIVSGVPLEPKDALSRHVEAANAILESWLERNDYTKDMEVVAAEHAMAYCPRTFTSRTCLRPDEAHLYADLRDDEIAGTADLIVVPKDKSRPILVLDHKTGISKDFSRPELVPQLLLLGVAACYLYGRSTFIPAVLHAPKGSDPYVFEGKELRVADMHEWLKQLRDQMALRGRGFMRPGPQCNECPMRTQCPAKAADLLEQAAKLVEKANVVGSELVLQQNDQAYSREERIGRLHLLITRFRELDKRATEEIRRVLQDEGLEPVRPDGKLLVLKTREVENLSKASIIRALGKVEGDKLIEKLRAQGCIEVSERNELHVK